MRSLLNFLPVDNETTSEKAIYKENFTSVKSSDLERENKNWIQ
jgi:hypothetical protein